MKKKWIVTALAACAIALAGCKIVSEPEPIAVQSVTINGSSTLTLEFAETRILTATVYPYNADNKTVIWSSSNTDAVGVDCFNGTITANNVGTSIITAQAGGKSATCEVTVKPQVIAVNYVTLNETTITLEPDARRILTATAHPDNADDKTATWSSSNPDVARVHSDGISDGMVVAMSPGTAIITAYVGDCTASCTVYVSETFVEQPGFPVPVEVESIELNTSTLLLEPNTTSELIATVTPPNADYTYILWTSSDTSIAYVDFNGTVKTYGEGTAIITAQVGDKTAECEVTIRHIANPVTGVTIDQKTLTLTRGETGKLTATVTPNNADYTNVIWRTTDWDIADVDSWDGTVTARQMGTVTITATTVEGGLTATCEVTVLPLIPVDSLTLDYTTLLLADGETVRLYAEATPDDADDTSVTWSSSDETIVMVDSVGPSAARITAHNTGEATITATALAGGKTAECIVTVHKHSYSGGKCTVCGVNPKIEGGTIDENGVLTKYYANNTKPVVIPEGVTGIGNEAFYSYTSSSPTSVTIPDSVTFIGDSAFKECKNLNSVKIGNGVTSIGDSAFRQCGITNVTIPNSVKSIGKTAFFACMNLTSVTIGSGVTSIGNSAFSGCTRLASVTIPDSVTNIEVGAFYGCTNLTSVTIPNSVKSIGYDAFAGCTSLTKIQFNGTKAQWNAIKGSDYVDITCIICSDGYIGVKDVPSYLKMSGRTVTGYNSGIPASLVIPDGVKSIGDRAFKDCTSITSVTIPSSVKSIGDQAFEKCTSLTSVTIPNSVTEIGNGAFKWCTSLTSVTIPASVTEISTEMFHGCTDLNKVTIENGVTKIGLRAFYNTYLTSIEIPDSVTYIDNSAFSNCEFLLNIKIPNSVTYIGPYAFFECKLLNSAEILANVPRIGGFMFSGCTGLKSVTIPASVTKIETEAFNECTSLTEIQFKGTTTEWKAIEKGDKWNYHAGSYTITCTDGSLSK